MRSLLHRLVLALVLLGLLGCVDASYAASAAIVEGVQMPAWVERAGKRIPVLPGMELRAGDRLSTGAGSRLLVKLSEGSTVKLGENGTLLLKELDPAKDLFRAALGLLEGAFRFTTEVLAHSRRREINISVATVTAGVRGTDLWGKSFEDKQIVCLLEGKIEVGAPNETPVTMDQPRQFYQRDKGVTAPVGFVPEAMLANWAKQTELEPGKGTARRGGKWKLELASADNQADALGVYDQLRAAGYAAQIHPVKGDGGKLVYVVRIRNLASKADAQALGAQLRGKYGVTEPKIAS